MPIILAVENLKKIYNETMPVVAVNEISFHLNVGEILGLLGPNGSGKTTTIQMLLGTLLSTSGSIHYFNKDFSIFRNEILQNVSFASTYTSLPWILTVKENLEVFGYLYGYTRNESAKLFDPLLERFGILNKRNHRVSSLSAGQVTRLMLVKAFFIQPKVVLLDEPTASLDPDIANDICSFLLEERDKQGISMLFTSHKMEEVMKTCDRVIFLENGHIIADDTPSKLAKSVSNFRIKLLIIEGLETAKQIARNSSLEYDIHHHLIEVKINEENIPIFLDALSKAFVRYANIKIEEPSLEDFFIQTTKRTRLNL